MRALIGYELLCALVQPDISPENRAVADWFAQQQRAPQPLRFFAASTTFAVVEADALSAPGGAPNTRGTLMRFRATMFRARRVYEIDERVTSVLGRLLAWWDAREPQIDADAFELVECAVALEHGRCLIAPASPLITELQITHQLRWFDPWQQLGVQAPAKPKATRR